MCADIPELSHLIGDKHIDELSKTADAPSALSRCFAQLITSPDTDVKSQLSRLVSRVNQESRYYIYFLNHAKSFNSNQILIVIILPVYIKIDI